MSVSRGEPVQRIHLVVTGRVQGVGFRAFTQAEAERLGITGWVRNDRGGSVEIVAEGERDRLAAFLRSIRLGPPGSKVIDIRQRTLGGDREFADFAIRRGSE